MTQYARPDEDDGIGSWDNADEDQTDLFNNHSFIIAIPIKPPP